MLITEINNVRFQGNDVQTCVTAAISICITTENSQCDFRYFCLQLLPQNESDLLSYAYLVTQLVIPTTALVTDDDLVVCLRL
jgi:hypothetical protein